MCNGQAKQLIALVMQIPAFTITFVSLPKTLSLLATTAKEFVDSAYPNHLIQHFVRRKIRLLQAGFIYRRLGQSWKQVFICQDQSCPKAEYLEA